MKPVSSNYESQDDYRACIGRRHKNQSLQVNNGHEPVGLVHVAVRSGDHTTFPAHGALLRC